MGIFNDVKKVLGLAPDYDAFDTDILMHINSVIFTLRQLGIGPLVTFSVDDDTKTWADLLGSDPRFAAAKTYICLKIQLLFDPPTTSYLIDAKKNQIQEFEWRLNVEREETDWVDPDPVIIDEEV